MFKRTILRVFNITRNRCLYQNRRHFSERTRRRGDGTKTDIFEERATASMEKYFRKETARQLKKIKEAIEKRQKSEAEKKDTEKNN